MKYFMSLYLVLLFCGAAIADAARSKEVERTVDKEKTVVNGRVEKSKEVTRKVEKTKEVEKVRAGSKPCTPPYGHPVAWRVRYKNHPRAYAKRYPHAIPYCPKCDPPRVDEPFDATPDEEASSSRTKTKVKETTRTKSPTLKGAEETTEEEAPAEPAKYSNHPTIQSMLAECNRLRKEAGKPDVKINESLCVAAQKYAELCAKVNKGGHKVGKTTPTERAAAEGYKSTGVSEVWAGGQANVGAAFAAWMSSRGHKKIVLGSSTEVGFGYAADSSGQPHSYVGMFAN